MITWKKPCGGRMRRWRCWNGCVSPSLMPSPRRRSPGGGRREARRWTAPKSVTVELHDGPVWHGDVQRLWHRRRALTAVPAWLQGPAPVRAARRVRSGHSGLGGPDVAGRQERARRASSSSFSDPEERDQWTVVLIDALLARYALVDSMSDLRDTAFLEQFPTLETERLRLRESRPMMPRRILPCCPRRKSAAITTCRRCKSVDEAAQPSSRSRAAAFARRERIRWALARREDDGVIGSCGSVPLGRGSRAGGSRLRAGARLAGARADAGGADGGAGLRLRARCSCAEWRRMSCRKTNPPCACSGGSASARWNCGAGAAFWKGQSHDLIHHLLHREDWHE